MLVSFSVGPEPGAPKRETAATEGALNPGTLISPITVIGREVGEGDKLPLLDRGAGEPAGFSREGTGSVFHRREGSATAGSSRPPLIFQPEMSYWCTCHLSCRSSFVCLCRAGGPHQHYSPAEEEPGSSDAHGSGSSGSGQGSRTPHRYVTSPALLSLPRAHCTAPLKFCKFRNSKF